MHNWFGATRHSTASAARRARRVIAPLALAIGLGGCGYALPSGTLPDLIRDPRKLLTKEEQQQAIDELSEKKAAQQAAQQADTAAKQGEKPR